MVKTSLQAATQRSLKVEPKSINATLQPNRTGCAAKLPTTKLSVWQPGPLDLGACLDDPSDPSSGTGTTSSSGSTSTGAPSCAVECPEDGGACPGHAEWTRGVVVWGVWQSNDSSGQPSGSYTVNVSNLPDDEPRCATIGVCQAYESPTDIPALSPDMIQQQIAECNAFSLSDLNGLGLDDIAVGQYGHTLVHHFCTLGKLDIDYQGQSFDVNLPSALDSCAGSDWQYGQFCGSQDCPTSEPETTGSADASSGGNEVEGIDCSAFVPSNVDTESPDRTNPSLRESTVRGGIPDILSSGSAYDHMFHCAGASIDSTGKIHGMQQGSFLGAGGFGLRDFDVLQSINGETDSVLMMNELVTDIGKDPVPNETTIKIQRKTENVGIHRDLGQVTQKKEQTWKKKKLKNSSRKSFRVPQLKALKLRFSGCSVD